MKKRAFDWPLLYALLVIGLGLFVSGEIITDLGRYGSGVLTNLYYVLGLGLAVLLFSIIDLKPLSFQDVEICLSFIVVWATLLILIDQFSANSAVAVLSATGVAALGSLLSEALRQLAGHRLPTGRSLVRVLFYAALHTLAGFVAAQAYLRFRGSELGQGVGQELAKLYIQPALAYALVYAFTYSVVSQVVVCPHDWAFDRLLLPANEKRFPRVDLLTLVTIAPIPLVLFHLFGEKAVWEFIFFFLLYLSVLLGLGSYSNIAAQQRHQAHMDGLKQEFEKPINMNELVRQVHAVLSKEVDYQYAAIYSAGSHRSAESDVTVYYLRGTLWKTQTTSDFFSYEPRFLEERIRLSGMRIKDGGAPPEQMVYWPGQVLSTEGYLGGVARIGQPSPNVRGEGDPSASESDPALPPQMIAMYLPVQYEGKTVGLLALARSPKRFMEREQKQVEYLAEAMSAPLQRIQEFEERLQNLYDGAKEYTADRDKFQRVVQGLIEKRVDVFLILDSIMQSTFRSNVLWVMRGIVGPAGAPEQGEIYLSDNVLREIYEEVRHKKPDMPELDDEILGNLRLIPSSLSLAFSFRYQWPKLSRGPEFTRLYKFLVRAMEARSVDDIVGLCAEKLGVAREPDATVEELERANFPHREIIDRLEDMAQIIDTLKQNLVYEAMDEVARLKDSVSEHVRDPEKFVFLTLLGDWHTIIYTTIAEREGAVEGGEARLDIALRSKYALPVEPVTIGLRLENVGRGSAFQVAVELLSPLAYRVMGESQVRLGLVPPWKKHDLEFSIEPVESRELGVQFRITYQDVEPRQVRFEDTLCLREAPPPFTPIPNPYVPGRSLSMNSSVFFGREDIFEFVNQNMSASASQQRILLLIGERRIGKTSILWQLPVRVEDKRYVHVFFDCQAIEGAPSVAGFFRRLAAVICNALEKEGFFVDCPSDDDLARDAYLALEQKFLPQVWERIGDRCLLVAVDEFERLDRQVEEGKLNGVDFAAPLRALMQSQNRMAFVFAGTRQLEALFSRYWSVLFNMAQQETIGFLNEEDAKRLITEPVREHRVYDDLALDGILRATGGHPYFLQLMCVNLMNTCHVERRSYVTIHDARNASESVLAAGQVHLDFIWSESDQVERDVLAGLAKSLALDPRATVETIAGHLEKAGRPRTQPEIRDALQRLQTRRYIVTREQEPGEIGHYKFTADLYRLWIQKYHSLD